MHYFCVATAPRDRAEELARRLVEERLVACVNVAPVRSVYRWEGEIQSDDEAVLTLKTTRDAWPRLRERFVELHPYDVPELIALPIEAGLPAYLSWVTDEVSADGGAS